MTDETVYLTTLDNAKTAVFGRGTLGKTSITFSLVAILGVILGVFIIYAGGLAYKWAFVIAIAGCFPLLVIAMGSLKRALEFCLILSLSMHLDIYPWFSERYQERVLGVPVTLTGILLFALFVLWAIRLFQKTAKVRFFPGVTIPFAMLVILSGLSFLWAAKAHCVASGFPLVLQAFFLFFYAANFLRPGEDIRFLIKCLAVTVAITGMLGISQYVSGSSLNIQFMGGRESQLEQQYHAVTISRVSGFLGHSNFLGFFLSGWLPVLLVCAIGLSTFRSRLLYLLSFSLGLVTLVVTYSRGSWIAFGFSFVLIACFWMTKESRSKFRGAFLRILFLIVAVTVLTAPFFPKIITRLTKDDYGAAYSRIPLAQTALKIVRDNWVRGVGLGNYGFVVEDYENYPLLDRYGVPMRVHNIYLHTAAELGIPALAIFIWILVFFLRQGLVALRSANRGISLVALGLVSGLAGCYLHGMIEPGTLGHHTLVILWFMGGILVALSQFVKQRGGLSVQGKGEPNCL